MQVDASDLLDEAVDYDAPEAFEEEATTVFSDDQVRGFMDEGVADDEFDEIPEDEDHTAIFDPNAHGGSHGYDPAPQAYSAPARGAGTMKFSPADASAIKAAAAAYNAPQQARQQSAVRTTNRPAVSQSSPAVSAPIPRQRVQSASRPAYQEEATVVTDGAAFRAAAERMNPSLAPPRASGSQQTVRPQPVVATPAPQAGSGSGGRWSPTQVILAVLLLLAIGGVGFLSFKLIQRDGGAATETGTLLVRTVPPGATIRIGDRVIDDKSPAVINGLALNEPLVLSIQLDGYEPANDVVILSDWEPAERDFELQAATVSMVITSLPAGATISVDGVEKGTAPQTVEGLDRSRSYSVTANLDGHAPADQTVRWSDDTDAQQVIVLTMTPIEAEGSGDAVAEGAAEDAAPAPEPAAAPASSRTTARTSAQSRPAATTTSTARPSERPRPGTTTTTTARPSERERPSAAAPTTARPSERERPSAAARPSERERPSAAAAPAAGNATISVQAVPFGQVWIDGRMVARETPLLNHTLPSGTHRVKVYFEALRQFSDERTIRLDAGASQSLTFRAPR